VMQWDSVGNTTARRFLFIFAGSRYRGLHGVGIAGQPSSSQTLCIAALNC
jgi:hypothetical protein